MSRWTASSRTKENQNEISTDPWRDAGRARGAWGRPKAGPLHRPAPAEKKTAERKAEEPKKDAAAGKDKEAKDELAETTNTVSINGVLVKYKATAGTMVIKDEEGKPLVSFFFIAYTSLAHTNVSRAAHHLLLQRRPRFVLRLVAFGPAGSAAGLSQGRRRVAASALPLGQ